MTLSVSDSARALWAGPTLRPRQTLGLVPLTAPSNDLAPVALPA